MPTVRDFPLSQVSGWVLAVVLAATMGSVIPVQAAVYRSVDSAGNVTYTDSPTTAYHHSHDSQKITLMDALTSENTASVSHNTHPSPTVSGNNSTTDARSNDPNSRISQQGDYQIAIQSPAADMVYRRPAQSIDIAVEVRPSLKPGDRLVYRVNGKHIATTQDTHYQISTLDFVPEQYTLTVEIQNIKGAVIASASCPFYVLQNTALLRQKRQAAAEQAAYNRLPWYQKILVRRNTN